MNLNRTTKILLLVTIVVLLSTTMAISRDYQDSWILEGLEVPFAFFAVTYAVAFFSEKRVAAMVTLAVVARCIFLMVPNLKYVWFQGTAIDQQTQYGLANYVYKGGHIATESTYGVSVYGSTPLIHLSLAMFSIVLNVPIVESMKYLPVLMSSIYPLATYAIVKSLKFPKGQSILRYALFISSIPISVENYIITGSQFGVLFAFLALTTLSMLVRTNDRRYWLVFLFFIFGLAMIHSVSSLLLTIFLLVAVAIQRIPVLKVIRSLRVPIVLAATSICIAWLMFSARPTFETVVRLGIGSVKGETTESVPPRFFELVQVDVVGAFNTLLSTSGAELLLFLLSSAGLIVLLRMSKHLEKRSKSLLLIGAVIFLFVPIGILLKIGMFRIVFFASILFPVFASALFFKYSGKRARWVRRVVFFSIVPLIMLVATLGLYGCQPLMPSASVLSKDLSMDTPIGYVTRVNSIYQRQMVEFVQRYCSGRIASDATTANQVVGLAEFNFSITYLTFYYPLDQKQIVQEYDYFLIHLPGIGGPFENPAETRTESLVLGAIYNSSNVYTNGESFVLLNMTGSAPP